MKGTLVLLLGMIGSLLAASDLPRLRVEGDPILAGEKKIRLRGINRRWWNSRGTRYTEENMKQLSERDANVLRLRDNPSGDNGSSGSEKRRQLLSGQLASAERPEKSLGKESRMTVLPAIGSDLLFFLCRDAVQRSSLWQALRYARGVRPVCFLKSREK